ncbi:MAG: BlaI/MecI/CopY family transcriptional regulator [Acetatifactor sp.]
MQDGELSRLSESEYRLMEIVWENGQIEASVLAGICLERFDWKKSTVYTMLKRLGDKGALLFEKRMVKPLIEKEQIDRSESEALLNKSFGGSLPNFMAAFLQGRKLTEEEANRLLEMIEEATK